MATPTSSSNRSKRKTTKPVTADKGRTNRARVSTAKTTSSDTRSSNSGTRVTNASQRTSTGSARVTGTSRQALPAKSSASDLQRLQTASKTKPTRPAPRSTPKAQSRPALPPGERGGSLVTQGTRRSRAEAKASNAAKGSTGPNRVGRSDARPALPPGKPGGAMTRASAGGALARTSTGTPVGAGATVRGLLGKAGRALLPIQLGMMGADAATQAGYARGGKNYKEFVRAQDKPLNKPAPKPTQGNAQSRFAGAREANLNRINNDPRFAAPKAQGKPKAEKEKDRAAAPAPSLPRAVTAPRTSRPSSTNAPSSSPTLRKGEDQNKNRGSYVSQFKEETARMTAASMVRQQNRGNMTSEDLKPKQNNNIKTNYDGSTNVYEPKTKPAPNYSKAKIDQKKVDEYGRRKKRYYD